ncbi:hypothetical protein A2630_04275 [Candidatus Woesebacteria bacterium RIFCSPHIGHO2_01_FULL_44_10]|nr:MAG: hypothetical protein A2630_04275 [Candidatus Woesebacteria bacterium RIFCSPHIGHO2_01_FULL_44_10]
MKKLALLLLIPVVLIIAGLVWWKGVSGAPKADGSQVRLVIPKGASATQIANNLRKEELVKSAFAFKFYAGVTGVSRQIKAGEFRIANNLTLAQIVRELLKDPDEVWVTIPEGLRREEIAERYIANLELESSSATAFRSEFLALTKNKEGMLFPDTYLFPKEASASAVVAYMSSTFDTRMADLTEDIPATGLSLVQIVTLASIIERETITDEERPIVAGILIKRLDAGWPLQADASVQYVVGSADNWWPILTKDDLEVNSRYNTYKYAGLPPGPIASPGLSSLAAVVRSQDSPYWYYIHDTEGKIHYATSLEGHNLNIAKYLGK